MPRYLLSIVQPDGEAPPPDVLQRVMRDVGALIDEAKTAGVWVYNGGLYPPGEAVVVRADSGEPLVTDGPYLETREHLGGFLIVQVADRAAALAWATKMARVIGLPIEVRQFHGAAEG